MARGHPGIPKVSRLTLSKQDALDSLRQVDESEEARKRVLAIETDFRQRIKGHVEKLPLDDAKLEKFNTSPFVLLIHAKHRGYKRISEIESDILPAKLFSSMETSAGRMVEAVVLPVHGWECVTSKMHTTDSALDGSCLVGDTLRLATLKSGPRCLNDEMSENFADAIVNHAQAWANSAGVSHIDFTYGVLYGTKRRSNKKDWHILRNLEEKLPQKSMVVSPSGRWSCEFQLHQLRVEVSVRIGLDWWEYLGGELCLVEMAVAIIRACIEPGDADPAEHQYLINDLGATIATDCIANDFNVSILQRSQLPWLFFILSHFADDVE